MVLIKITVFKKRVIEFGTPRISALTELLLFCAEAPYNFLEREIGMKREVIVGKTFPIHFHS